MKVTLISHDGHAIFELLEPIEIPPGWMMSRVVGVKDGPFVIAEPRNLGYRPDSAPRRVYQWPWMRVRKTQEEAERDARPWRGGGDYVYGAAVKFPLGGWVWCQTGLKRALLAARRAAEIMAEVKATLEDGRTAPGGEGQGQ
jgi:hypothetical protein